MDFSSVNTKSFVLGGLAVAACAAAFCAFGCHASCDKKKYTIANQPLRFAQAKAANNKRMLDIDSVYKPEYVKGKVVVVTGTYYLIYSSSDCWVRYLIYSLLTLF